jgi:peroxiredoxin/tetratricopeptide (TPR) repeat protein
MFSLATVTLNFLCAGVFTLTAQEPAPFGHSQHGEAFDEGPRSAAYLMEGMSPQVHLPIAGLSAAAQSFFDQGLTQLHGFWYFEAERSFRQVAKLQPDCAMAYWGMTLANVESPERAVGLIAKALTHAAALPRQEQLWVDAWAAWYQVDAAARAELQSGDAARVKAATEALTKAFTEPSKDEKERRDKQLVKDIGTIVHEFPDETEAKALLAVHIWHAYNWGGGVPIVSHVAVDALLDQVFDKAPLHPARHYRIHLWDQEDAARALPSAALLGSTAPGIAHQWHMAGHIYAKLDRHDQAGWQQEASSRVDHAHMRRDRVMPFLIHNYGHNQGWMSESLSHQGRVTEALEIAKNMVELPRHPQYNRVSEGGDIARYARARLTGLVEDHELWETALELDRAGYLEPGEDVRGEVSRLSTVGRALFRLGRTAEAEAIVADAAALLPRARAERAQAVDKAEDEAITQNAERSKIDESLANAQRQATDVVRAVLDLQQELEAEQLLAAGDAAAALAIFEKIEGYPPALMADVKLMAGQAQAAVDLLEPLVREEPMRFETLARLVLAYRAAANPAQADALAQREAELAKMPAASGPLAQRLGLPASRAVTPADFPADFGTRPDLSTLGPKTWQPWSAPVSEVPLAPGKPTLVVFYLGFECLHCIEQLRALAPQAGAFADLGVDVVAIGTDTPERLALTLAEMDPAERFPFRLLADPAQRAFRQWRCYDDFEDMPLHGTFLVDAHGKVRWQDISYQPFTEIEWLVGESKRLLALSVVTLAQGQ